MLRLITRIDNSCAQSSAFGAVFQAVNGCAAHPSPQVLTLRAETCSLFIEITSLRGLVPPDTEELALQKIIERERIASEKGQSEM